MDFIKNERPSDFINDNKIGKIGENDFLKHRGYVLFACLGHGFGDNEWTHVDVADDSIVQLRDVDYLFVHPGSKFVNFSSLPEKERCETILHDDEDIIKVEVKTDTRIHETRNLVYELISHYKGGCFALTSANFVYYVCTDSKNFNDIKERFIVDVRKLRAYLTDNYGIMSNNPKDVMNPNVPIKMHRVDGKVKYNGKKEDPILNILFNIDNLVKFGIAQVINIPNNQ